MKRRYIILFFVAVGLAAALIFPSRLDLAAIYRKSGMYEEALYILNDEIRKNPSDVFLRTERAELMSELGEYGRALEDFQAATKAEPRNAEAWRGLGRAYILTGSVREATLAYQKLLEISPGDVDALMRLEENYRLLQEPEKAICVLERLVKMDLPNRETMLKHMQKLADLYLQTNRTAKAIDILYGILEMFPDDKGARDYCVSGLTQTLPLAGDYKRLIALFNKYGASFSTRLNAANQFRFEKNYDGAVLLFEPLYGKYPKDRDVVEGYICALLGKGNYDRALALARNFYTKADEQKNIYGILAGLFVAGGNRADAEIRLEKELSANAARIPSMLAVSLYLIDNKIDAAIRRAKMLVDREPGNREVNDLYFSALEAGNRRAEVLAELESINNRWPGDWDIMDNLAKAYDWNEKYEQELAVIEKMLAMKPGNTGLLSRKSAAILNLSNASMNKGRDNEALAYLLNAVKLKPGDADIVYNIALIYDRQKKAGDARGYFLKYLDMTRNSKSPAPSLVRNRIYALTKAGSRSELKNYLIVANGLLPNDVDIANDAAEMLVDDKEYDRALAILDRVERVKR